MFTSLSFALARGRNVPAQSESTPLVVNPHEVVSSYYAAYQWHLAPQLEAERGYYRVTTWGNYVPELTGEWQRQRLAASGWLQFSNSLLNSTRNATLHHPEGAWLDHWVELASTQLPVDASTQEESWCTELLASRDASLFAPRILAWLWYERTRAEPAQEQTYLSTAAQEVAQRYALQGNFYADARLWQDFPEQSYLPDLARLAQRAKEYRSDIFIEREFSVHMGETGIVGAAYQRNKELGLPHTGYGELTLQGQVQDVEWADVEAQLTTAQLSKFQQPLQELQARMGRIYLRYALDTTYQRYQQLDSESLDYDNLVDDVENCEIEPTLSGNNEERLFLSTILTHLDYNPAVQIGNLAAGEGHKVHYPTQVIHDLNLVRKGLRGTGHILYLSRALLLAPCHMRGYGASQFRAADNAYFFASPHVERAIKDLEQLQLFAYDELLVPNVAHYHALEQSLARGAPALERVALRSLEAQGELGRWHDLDSTTQKLLDKADYFSKLNQPVFPHLQVLYTKLDGQDHVGLRILADGEAVVNNHPTPSTYFQLHTFQEHQLWFQPWLTVPSMVQYPPLNEFFVARQTTATGAEITRLEKVVHNLHSLRLTPLEFVQLQTTHMGRKFLTKLLYYTGQSLMCYTPLLQVSALRKSLEVYDEDGDEREWLAEQLEELRGKYSGDSVDADLDELQFVSSAARASSKSDLAPTSTTSKSSTATKTSNRSASTAQYAPSNQGNSEAAASGELADLWSNPEAIDEYFKQRAAEFYANLQSGNITLPDAWTQMPLIAMGGEQGLSSILASPQMLQELGISRDEFNEMVQEVFGQSNKGIVELSRGHLLPGESTAEMVQRIVDENRDILGEDFELDQEDLERLQRKDQEYAHRAASAVDLASATSSNPITKTTLSSTSAPTSKAQESEAQAPQTSRVAPTATTVDSISSVQLEITGSVRDHIDDAFFRLGTAPHNALDGYEAVIVGFEEKLSNAWKVTNAQREQDALPPLQESEALRNDADRPSPEYGRDSVPQTTLLANSSELNQPEASVIIEPHTWVYWKHAFALPTATTVFQVNESEEAFYAASQAQRARPWQQASLRVKAREYDLRGQLQRLRQLQHRSLVQLTPASYMEWDFVSHYYTGFHANGWVARDGGVQPLHFNQITTTQEAHALWLGHAILATKTAYQQFMLAWSSRNRDTLTGSLQGRRHEFAQAVSLALDPQARAHAQAARQAYIAHEADSPRQLLAQLRTPELDATGQPLTRTQSELLGYAPHQAALDGVLRGEITQVEQMWGADLQVATNCEPVLAANRPAQDRATVTSTTAPSTSELNQGASSSGNTTSDTTHNPAAAGEATPNNAATSSLDARAQAHADKLENYINVLTQVGEDLHNVNTLGLTKIAELEQRYDTLERGGDAHYKHLLGLTRMHLETAIREEANLAATDWQLRLDRARNWSRAWGIANLEQQAFNLERYARLAMQQQQLSSLLANEQHLAQLYRNGKDYLQNPWDYSEFNPCLEELDGFEFATHYAINYNYGLAHTGMGMPLRRRYRNDGMGMYPCVPLPHEVHAVFRHYQQQQAPEDYAPEARDNDLTSKFAQLTTQNLGALDRYAAYANQLYLSPLVTDTIPSLADTKFWQKIPYKLNKLDYNWGAVAQREQYGMDVSRGELATAIVEWIQRRDWVLTPSRAQQFAQEYMQHSVQDDYHRSQKYVGLEGTAQQVALRTLQHDDMITRLRLWGQRNWREIEDCSRRLVFSTDWAYAPARLLQTTIDVFAQDAHTGFQPYQFEEERLRLLSDIRAYEANLAARLHHLTRALADELTAYTTQFNDATSQELLIEIAACCIEQDLLPLLDTWAPQPRARKGSKSTPRKSAEVPVAVLVETIQRSVVRHLRTALEILAADPTLHARVTAWEQASTNLQALLNLVLISWSMFQIDSEITESQLEYQISRSTHEQPYVRSELATLFQGLQRELLDGFNVFSSANLINSATEMAERMWQQGSELRSFIEIYAPTLQETPLGRTWLRTYLEQRNQLLGLGIDIELALQNYGKSELEVNYRHRDADEERHYQALRATRLHTRSFTLLRSILINQRWAAQSLQYQTTWQNQVRFILKGEAQTAQWRTYLSSTLGEQAATSEGVEFDYAVVQRAEQDVAQSEPAASAGSFRSVRVQAESKGQVISAPRLLHGLPMVYQGLNQEQLHTYNPEVREQASTPAPLATTHLSYNGLGGAQHALRSSNYQLQSRVAPATTDASQATPSEKATSTTPSYAATAQQLAQQERLEAQLVRAVTQPREAVDNSTTSAPAASTAPAARVVQSTSATEAATPRARTTAGTLELTQPEQQHSMLAAQSTLISGILGTRQVSLEIVEFSELEPQREPLVRIEIPQRQAHQAATTTSSTHSSASAARSAPERLSQATAGYDTLMPEAVQELYARQLQEVQVRNFTQALRAQVATTPAVSVPCATEVGEDASLTAAYTYFHTALINHVDQLLIHTPVQGELQVPGLALLEAVLVNRYLAGERKLPRSTSTSIANEIFYDNEKLGLELEALGIAREHLEQIFKFSRNGSSAHSKRICNFGRFEQSVESAFELLQEVRLYSILRLQLQGRLNLTEQYWDGYQARVRNMTMLHHLLRNTQVFYQAVNQACYYLDSRVLAPFLAYGDVSPSELQYLTYRLATETPVSELSLTYLGLVRGSYVFNHLPPISTVGQEQLAAERRLVEQGARWVSENLDFFPSVYEEWSERTRDKLIKVLKREIEAYKERFRPSHYLHHEQQAGIVSDRNFYTRLALAIQAEVQRCMPQPLKLPAWIEKESLYYVDLEERFPELTDYREGIVYISTNETHFYPEHVATDWGNSFTRVMRKIYDPEQWHIKQASLWLDSFNYLDRAAPQVRLPWQAQLATWGSAQLVTRLLPHKMIEGLVFQYLLRFEQYHDLESWMLQQLGSLAQVSDFTTMPLSKFWQFNELGNWGRMWQRLVGAVLDDSVSLADCFKFHVQQRKLVGYLPTSALDQAQSARGLEVTLKDVAQTQRELRAAWEQAVPSCAYQAGATPSVAMPSAGLFTTSGSANSTTPSRKPRSKSAQLKQAPTAQVTTGADLAGAPQPVVAATGLVEPPASTPRANPHCTPWVNFFHHLETATLLYEELGHATLAAGMRAQYQAWEQENVSNYHGATSFHPYESPTRTTDAPVFWDYREPGYLSAPCPAAPQLAGNDPNITQTYEVTDIDLHVRKWHNLATSYSTLQGAADLNFNELVNSMNEYVNLLRVPVTNLISDLDWTQGSSESEVVEAHDAARRASVTQALAQHQAQEELMLRRAQYLYALRAQREGGLATRLYLTAVAQLTPSLRAELVHLGDAATRAQSIVSSYVAQQLTQQYYQRILGGARHVPEELRTVMQVQLRGCYQPAAPAGQETTISQLSYPLQLHWMGYAAQYEANLVDYRAAQLAVERAVSELDPQLRTSYRELLVQVADLPFGAQAQGQDESSTSAMCDQLDYRTWTREQFELAQARAGALAVRVLYLGGADAQLVTDLTVQAEHQGKSFADYVSQVVSEAAHDTTGRGTQLRQLLEQQHGILPLLRAVTRLQVVSQRFLDLSANRATADLLITEAHRVLAAHPELEVQRMLQHPVLSATESETVRRDSGVELAAQPAVHSGLAQLPWDAALRLHDQGLSVSSTLSLSAVADLLESWSNLPYNLSNVALSEEQTGWFFKQLPVSYHLEVGERAQRAVWELPLHACYPYLAATGDNWWQMGAAAQAAFTSVNAQGVPLYSPSLGLEALVDYYAYHARDFQARLLRQFPSMSDQATPASDATTPLHTRHYKLTYAGLGNSEALGGEAPLLAIATRTEWLCTLARHSQHPAARQALPAFDRWQQAQLNASLLHGAERDLLEVRTTPLATSLPMHAEHALRMQQDPLYAEVILQQRGSMHRNLLVREQLDGELLAHLQQYLAQLPTPSGVLEADADLAPRGTHLVNFMVAPALQEVELAARLREVAADAGITQELSLRALQAGEPLTQLGQLEVESVVDTVASPEVLPVNLGDYTVRYTREQIDYQLLSELQIILARKTEQDYLTTQINRWVGALLDHNYRITHQVLANVHEPSLALNFIQHYNLTSHRWLSESANSFSVLLNNDYLRLLTEMRHSVNVIQDLLRAVAAGSQPAYAYFLTQLLCTHYTPEQRLASDYIRDGVLPSINQAPRKRSRMSKHSATYAALAALSESARAQVKESGLEAEVLGKGRALRHLTSYLNFQRYNLLGLRDTHPQASIMQLLDGDGFKRSELGTQNNADQWLRLLSIAQAVSPLQVAAWAFNYKVSNLTSHESVAIHAGIREHVDYHAGQPWVRPRVLDKYAQLRLSASPLVLPQATLATAEQSVRLRSLYRPYQLLHYQRATLTPSSSQFDYQGAMAIILKGFFPVHLRGTTDQYPTLNWKEDYPDVLSCTNLRDYLRSRPCQQFQLGGANFTDFSLFNGEHVGFAWNYDQEFVRSYAVDLLSEPARNSEAEQAWRKEHGLAFGHEHNPPRSAATSAPEVDLVTERTPRTTHDLSSLGSTDSANLYYTIFNYELSDYFARGVYGLPWAPRQELHTQLDYYTQVMGMGQGYFEIFTHLQRPTAMYVRQDELLTSIHADYLLSQAAQGEASARAELEAVYTPDSAALRTAQEICAQCATVATKYASGAQPPASEDVLTSAVQPRTIELHEGAVLLPLPAVVPTSWSWMSTVAEPTAAQREVNRWLRAQARHNYLLRLDAQRVPAARYRALAQLSAQQRQRLRAPELRATRYYQLWRQPL